MTGPTTRAEHTPQHSESVYDIHTTGPNIASLNRCTSISNPRLILRGGPSIFSPKSRPYMRLTELLNCLRKYANVYQRVHADLSLRDSTETYPGPGACLHKALQLLLLPPSFSFSQRRFYTMWKGKCGQVMRDLVLLEKICVELIRLACFVMSFVRHAVVGGLGQRLYDMIHTGHECPFFMFRRSVSRA